MLVDWLGWIGSPLDVVLGFRSSDGAVVDLGTGFGADSYPGPCPGSSFSLAVKAVGISFYFGSEFLELGGPQL